MYTLFSNCKYASFHVNILSVCIKQNQGVHLLNTADQAMWTVELAYLHFVEEMLTIHRLRKLNVDIFTSVTRQDNGSIHILCRCYITNIHHQCVNNFGKSLRNGKASEQNSLKKCSKE